MVAIFSVETGHLMTGLPRPREQPMALLPLVAGDRLEQVEAGALIVGALGVAAGVVVGD